MTSVGKLSEQSREIPWDISRDLPYSSVVKAQAEAVRKIDCEVLDGCQRAVDRWFERRHRTAEAMAELSRAACEARSPQDLLEAWMQWSQGAMSRLTEDARDQAETSLLIVNSLDTGLRSVAELGARADGGSALPRSRGVRGH